ncbi:MAG: MogA/MoaB family molybdenum cofactor biosynthesis protein [Deltaproteobacteria bacterium]|nr:MogA/MoaB family molybdenum cofactor biosynthesis protein [Deltaproteobacteria bacterium]
MSVGSLKAPYPAVIVLPWNSSEGPAVSIHEHKDKGKKSIRCFVITVSDTRGETTDLSGQTIKSLLSGEGHQTNGYCIVKDEPAQIEALLNEALASEDVDAVIVNGGTGIAPRDGTFEVVSRFLEKKLDGFGEIFRYLSYLDIGSAAIMSRAAAGTARGKVLISLPGSKGAVALAMEKLILPELRHMVSQLQGK